MFFHETPSTVSLKLVFLSLMVKKRWYTHEDKEDGKDNFRTWKMRQVGHNSAEKRNKYAEDLQSRMTVISSGFRLWDPLKTTN